MRFDDPEMSLLYHESIKANDYFGKGKVVDKKKLIDDFSINKNVQQRIDHYSKKANDFSKPNAELPKTIINVISIITLLILTFVFVGLPLFMGN